MKPIVTTTPIPVIVRGVHLSLTDALRAYAEHKTARLSHHEERIIRIRIDLEHDDTRAASARFTAKGHVEVSGNDLIASETADDAYKAIDFLVDKLDRMIRERGRVRRDRRNNSASAELPAESGSE
jgi:putative sigma-54 modulation protein